MKSTTLIGCLLFWCAALSFAADNPKPSNPDATAFFENKVRPVLFDKCLPCHGDKLQQSGLRLDSREAILKGGKRGPTIVPNEPEKSLLVQAIHHEGELKMPPTGKLPDAEIAALTEWVSIGAPFPEPRKTQDATRNTPHWAFQPLKKIPIPKVKNKWWVKTPIDAFIMAELEKNGMKPNPYADRRTLIRRAYFDLIGLPPMPEEVEAFVNDKSPDAWEKVIDHLLDSLHYGERWGRHWLDLARFAESHGYEQDYDRPNAYHYRDFVIKALNVDLPYDQFVKWQIAGDEFEPDNPLALMATGFLAAGTHATQITKNQVEKERYDELDDKLSTIGTAMLGLTIGCARCHDHKYDPIPQSDYYRLLSTFTKTVRSDYDINMDAKGYKDAKDAFDKAHAPLVEALRKYEGEQLPQRMERWLKGVQVLHTIAAESPRWLILDATKFQSKGGATFTELEDGSWLASGKNPDNDAYTFVAHTYLKGITAIRLEAMSHPSFVKSGPGRASNGNFALTDFRVTAAPLSTTQPPNTPTTQQPVALKLVNPRATFEQQGLPIKAAIDDDPKSGWAVDPQFGKDHAATFEFERAIGFEGGTVLTFTFKFDNNVMHSIGRLRLSVTTATRPLSLEEFAMPEIVQRVLTGESQLNNETRPVMLRWYRTIDPQWQALNKRVQEHQAQEPKPKLQKTLICSEGIPAVRTHTQGGDFLDHTHFLKRGDPNNKGEIATQSFLTVMMRAPEKEKRWQEPPPPGWRTPYLRRSLAHWITDVDHGAGHLLARVIVNRLWQHHFGRGIVATPSDFGTQGEKPTHPELLDWLASVFVEIGRLGNKEIGQQNISQFPNFPISPCGCGWSLKKMHKLMLMSATYQQSSLISHPSSLIKDPDNKLCWRRSRQRLEAEVIRDAMLSVSGLLDRTMFGLGTLDETMKRRSIYFFVKRSKLIPTMILFDAPNALTPIPVRPTTTIAPQALMLLNNQNVRTYAHAFAKRIAGSPREEAVKSAYMIALSRQPDARELSDTLTFLEQQTASYKAAGQENAEEMARADFCQVLMGLNEFVYVD